MAVTTELLLTRHGEAACNVVGTVGGNQGCTGLTPLGRQQVEHLAARLTRIHIDRPFDVVYTTLRRRVQETAEIVTRTLGLPAVVVADLRGPDHGDADGHPWHEVKAAFGGPPQHNPDQPSKPPTLSCSASQPAPAGTPDSSPITLASPTGSGTSTGSTKPCGCS